METRPLFSLILKMMKQIVWLLILALCLGACREGTKKEKSLEEAKLNLERTMHLTAQDTIAVETLVTMFMDLAQRQRLDSAVMLLRTAKLHQQPQPLDANARKEIVDILGKFPVSDYEIVHIAFKNAGSNEVKCRVYAQTGHSTNWYFKPVRYIGRWSLCLKEAEDKPLK